MLWLLAALSVVLGFFFTCSKWALRRYSLERELQLVPSGF
jgi:hypothetical protein